MLHEIIKKAVDHEKMLHEVLAQEAEKYKDKIDDTIYDFSIKYYDQVDDMLKAYAESLKLYNRLHTHNPMFTIRAFSELCPEETTKLLYFPKDCPFGISVAPYANLNRCLQLRYFGQDEFTANAFQPSQVTLHDPMDENDPAVLTQLLDAINSCFKEFPDFYEEFAKEVEKRFPPV